MWTITGFADEVATDFAAQLDAMGALGVRFIELRSAWGTRVLDLSDAQVRQVKTMLDDAGIAVSALGTDLGKISVTDDFGPHLDRMRRAADVAFFLETTDLRGFSFFIPPGDDPAQHRGLVGDRLAQLVQIAHDEGIRYLHENEKGIYGDTPQRCAELAAQLSPHAFRLILDPANYVQCGVRPLEEAYPLVREATVYLHAKDALADGTVCPVGHGDGQWPELLATLQADGYDGFISVEPHLGAHDAFGGHSGPELWATAHRALIGQLDQAGIPWA